MFIANPNNYAVKGFSFYYYQYKYLFAVVLLAVLNRI